MPQRCTSVWCCFCGGDSSSSDEDGVEPSIPQPAQIVQDPGTTSQLEDVMFPMDEDLEEGEWDQADRSSDDLGVDNENEEGVFPADNQPKQAKPEPVEPKKTQVKKTQPEPAQPEVQDTRDRPAPPEWLRVRGRRILRWIENSSEPHCPVSPHTITFEQVSQDVDVKVREGLEFPAGLREIPTEDLIRLGSCTSFSARYRQVFWSGMTAPKTLIIRNISRCEKAEADQPHSSELALAFYQRDQPLESLKYVFVTAISNAQTRHYLERQLYRGVWPRDGQDLNRSEMQNLMETRIWERESNEFLSLMGTRIGRTVGYLVLGAFPRGTHRIARIHTSVMNLRRYQFEFRFEIEPISTQAAE